MKNRLEIKPLFAIFIVPILFFCNTVYAENIDPFEDGSQYAYSENTGWQNAEPGGEGGDGVEVEASLLTGFIWTENVGWDAPPPGEDTGWPEDTSNRLRPWYSSGACSAYG